MRTWVHYNFHKKCWSLRDPRNKRVFLRSNYLLLKDCEFKVSEAGRQRVLRDKRKNVHAYIDGYMVANGLESTIKTNGMKKITYDPYKFSSFVLCNNIDKEVKAANKVVMTPRGVYASGIKYK